MNNNVYKRKLLLTGLMHIYRRYLPNPVHINDIFKDIGDGTTLIHLLEVLSGEKLQIENPRVIQRAHKLSNVRNALDYLEKTCKIKLVNINPADVVDGKPAIVLGLIWSIILFFQIQGHQKILRDALKSRRKSLSKSIDSDGSVSTTANSGSKSEEASLSEQVDSVKSVTGSRTRQALLTWVEQSFRSHKSTLEIKVNDFGTSWRDGKAFCALVHNINPSLIDMDEVMRRKSRENIELAFNIAEQRLGIPKLLDAEDVDVDKPDERSIITYVAQFILATSSCAPKIKSRSNSRRSSTNSSEKLQFQQKLKSTNADVQNESKPENEHHTPLRLASFEPDPEIDPALILNASTTANFLERRRARRASLSGPQTMDDEALHNLILATSPMSSGTGGASTPTDDAAAILSSSTPGGYIRTVSGSPSPPSFSTSPHRSGRARSYAGLRLCRVAKNVSKCRAIANIRVTAEPPKATCNIVPVLHLGGEGIDQTEAEKERILLINIKELIARVRHNPIDSQDFITEFESFLQAQLEHENMAAYIRELDDRKRQGLLLGLRPEELERAEAEWSRVKPELDEWRWRLDNVLPGEWRKVGHWLSKLEKCLIADALIASQLGLELAPEAKHLTLEERGTRLQNCLNEHEEIFKNIEELNELINRLDEENIKLNEIAQSASSDVLTTLPTRLPQIVVDSLKSRFITAYINGQLTRRRLERLVLRWDLAHKITILREHLVDWQGIKCKEKSEVNLHINVIKDYLSSLNMPEDMDKGLNRLKELTYERDDIACNIAEQRGKLESKANLSGPMINQQASVSTGGGAFILSDYAETERKETSFFLTSLNTRWKDTWSDLLSMQTQLGELSLKWNLYETEKVNLSNWLNDVRKLLADENTSAEIREQLYNDLKEWRTRVSALNDLGHELMHTCDMTASSALDNELQNINKNWTEVTSEVIKFVDLDHAEELKNRNSEAMLRVNALIKATEHLLVSDFILPETTDIDQAHAATADYRRQLEDARKQLLEKAKRDYLEALQAAEELMAAAKAGQADMAQAEEVMAAVRAAGKRLDQLANESVQARLDEVEAATKKAVELALQLAPINDWVQDSEVSTEILSSGSIETNLDLSNLTTEEALSKLKCHFTALEEHEKSLIEAEKRLNDLKESGLQHVDISQLELATLEARRKVEAMRAVAKCYEHELDKRKSAEQSFSYAITNISDWLDEAERLFCIDSTLEFEEQLPNTEVIQDKLTAHEEFLRKTQTAGQTCLIELNQSYDKLVDLLSGNGEDMIENSANTLIQPDDVSMNILLEAANQVTKFRDRFDELMSKATRRQYELKYSLLEARLREHLDNTNKILNDEEFRMTSGEHLASILADHEATFKNPQLYNICEDILREMRELDEQMSFLFQNDTNYYSKRTTQLQQEYNLLTERVGKMAVRLRNLPEQWADFDDKLNHLLDWTNEVEKLFNHLQSDPSSAKNSDEKTAIELASRYRAMLSRFEEMTGMVSEQNALADKLNLMLVDLSLDGGVSAGELATKRAALTAALGALKDLGSEIDSVLMRAPLIAETLEFRANAVTERKKAIVVREAFEQAIQEDAEMSPNDLESIKRLLAEREAMVARLAEERDASLLAIIQRGMSVKAGEMLDWIEPSKTELKATWAEVDKFAETGLKSLRQTAEAFEAFEEHKQRITSLLTGTRHLISGHASAAAAAAFAMALTSKDGEVDVDSVTNALHIDDETKVWANTSLASGIAGVVAASVEEATKAGQEAVRVQADAVAAQLEALNNAESDLKALIAAAETMKMRSTPERAAELDATIKRLEAQLITAKQELNTKLANLRAANGKWEVFYTSTREVDKLLNIAESNLSDVTSVKPLSKGNLNTLDLGSAESAAKAAAAELALWYASVNNYLKDLQTSEQRLSSLNIIFKELTHFSPLDSFTELSKNEVSDATSVSPEILKAQNRIVSLYRRQNALQTAFIKHSESLNTLKDYLSQYLNLVPSIDEYLSEVESIAGTLSRNPPIDSFADLITLRDKHNTRQTIHNSKFTDNRNKLLWLATNLTSWEHFKEANEVLQSRWESVNYWLIEESQYLDDLHNLWTTWNNDSEQFTTQLSSIEKEIEQELNSAMNDATKVKESSTEPNTVDLDSRVNKASTYQDRLLDAESYLKAFSFKTEKLLKRILAQSQIHCRTLSSANETNAAKLTDKLSSILNNNTNSQFMNVTISPHNVAVKYRELEEHLKRIRLQCEKLNSELENQLDARDRLFRDADRLLQWVMSAEKRMAKLTRVWVAARPPITVNNKSYSILHKPSSIMKARSDQNESDKQQLIGVDLPEAYEQLKALLTEASGPRMIALKELAYQIEGEDVDLTDLCQKATNSRPGSNRPDSNSSRPTSSNRSRSRRSVSFDILGKEGSFDSTNDEINRQLHERLIRLLGKLNRLITHLHQRTILCRLTIEYEYCRQGWIQEINALNSRLKTFENTSIVVELDVCKKKRRSSSKSSQEEVDRKQSIQDEDILEKQDTEINEDKVNVTGKMNEPTTTVQDDHDTSNITMNSKRSITTNDILQAATDDAERILFRKQTIQSGIVYQSEYRNLKSEVDKLKELINKWQVSLDLTQSDHAIESEFDETSGDINLVGPKEVDVAVVSVGLMFVTNVDSNWSFNIGATMTATMINAATTATINAPSSTGALDLQSAALQVEPFSFFVDIARLSSECDKLHGKLKANLLHVIGVCENWQQLIEARDKLLDQIKDLQARSSEACYSISQLNDPSKTDKPIGVRLTRLGQQLLDWQMELNSSRSTVTNETNVLQTDVSNNSHDPSVDKTNLPSEAVIIIQRLGDLRRAGERIVSLNAARGPNVDNLYNTTVQSVRLCAIYLGEIGRHSILLFQALTKRVECLNQLTEFLDEIEKQSGLIPSSEHQSVFGSVTVEENQIETNQTINISEKKIKQPISEEIASQLTMFECMDLCRLLSVDNIKELEQQLTPCQFALNSLISKQSTYFTQLNQSCSLALQMFHEFQTEIHKYINKTADITDEENKSSLEKHADPFRDALISRWQRLHLRLETAIQQLCIRRGAFKYVEEGFKELESWLESTELTVETCSSQLAANAAASAILLPFNLHSEQLPSDEDIEFTENPQLILDTYTTEVVYYSTLLSSLNDRIEADLADRVILRKTLDSLEWRLSKLQKSTDHLSHQWNEEYERCEQLKADLRKFDSLLESIAKELTYCFDLSTCKASEDIENSTIQYGTDVKSIYVHANSCLLQLCKAQCIRHRLVRFRDHSLWLHDRAHLLAIGPSRYHHRPIHPITTDQQSNDLSNENKPPETFTGSILLESESVSLNHRLSGLIAQSTKSVHILHSKINHIFLDVAQSFRVWFDDLQSTMSGLHSVTTLPTCMTITTKSNGSTSYSHQPMQILSVDVLSSNLKAVYLTIQDLSKKIQGTETQVDILKELAKIMLRSQFIDVEPHYSNQTTEGDHLKNEELSQPSLSNRILVDEVQPLLTPESLLESVEDKVKHFTTDTYNVVDTIEDDNQLSILWTNLNSDVSLIVHSDSVNQLIRLWENQLINMCSELKQIELKINTAQKLAVQLKEYEVSITDNMVVHEKQCKEIVLWQKSITVESCKIRLDELQHLIVQSDETRTELKQAYEIFNQLIKISNIASSSSFYEFNIPGGDFIQNDVPEKSVETPVYKSTVLLEIESRLIALQSCLKEAIQNTTELISALENQQLLYNDAHDWVEDVTNQLHTIIKERRETPSSRDTAQKYFNLIQNLNTKSDTGRSKVQSAQSAIEHACYLISNSESFLYKNDTYCILSSSTKQSKFDETLKSPESLQLSSITTSSTFRSQFISELCDQLLNNSTKLNNCYNLYLNEIGILLNEIESDLSRWTSYIDSKLRLEKWLNSVELDWNVANLTDSDEVGDNLENKMYFITLYKVVLLICVHSSFTCFCRFLSSFVIIFLFDSITVFFAYCSI
ncbi:Nesprin-1 [Schistosoma japonicum]|nr:Nesprin-1 [Schistosoma japonicum]